MNRSHSYIHTHESVRVVPTYTDVLNIHARTLNRTQNPNQNQSWMKTMSLSLSLKSLMMMMMRTMKTNLRAFCAILNVFSCFSCLTGAVPFFAAGGSGSYLCDVCVCMYVYVGIRFVPEEFPVNSWSQILRRCYSRDTPTVLLQRYSDGVCASRTQHT